MSTSTELFSLLNGWDAPHTEREISTTPGSVQLLDLHLSLPHDINSYPISKFSRQYIRDRVLGYQSTPIRLPFLPKQTAADNSESVKIFQLILQYMSESGLSDEKRRLLGSFIIQKGLTSPWLRDEIFVQLCNQTMADRSKYDQQLTRAWHLLSLCLSTFPPSKELYKYLLKYVSDCKPSGEYNVVCQQKLLQCYNVEPRMSRIYPPTLLEWETTRRKACMALNVGFPDGEKMMGHVESWLTGESFARQLLHNRGLGGENGWTVTLRDDGDLYECAGYDYVLDFIGEMEVVPMFPCSFAYYLTMSGQTGANSKYPYNEQPHTADRPRLMPLEVSENLESLISADIGFTPAPTIIPPPPRRPRTPTPPPASPEPSITVPASPMPSPRPPTPPPPEPVKKPETYASNNEALSQQSALNRRHDSLPENLASGSRLNTRYAHASNRPPSIEEAIYEETFDDIMNHRPEPPRQPVFAPMPPVKRPSMPRAPRNPLNFRAPVDANQSEHENVAFQIDSMFGDIMEDMTGLTDPFAMGEAIKGGGDKPAPAQKQTSVDLENQLKTKLLEAEVIQKTIELEKYKEEVEKLKSEGHVTNGTVDQKKTPPLTKPKTIPITANKVTVPPPPPLAQSSSGVAASLSIPPPPPPPQPIQEIITVTKAPEVKQQNGSVEQNERRPESEQDREVVKATPAGGTYHKTPKKIGQIRWPPSSEKEAVVDPKPVPGKIVISEETEKSIIIVPNVDNQRKVNEMLTAAKIKKQREEDLKRVEEEENKKRLTRLKSGAAAPAVVAAAAATVQRVRHPSEESEYDDILNESTQDFKTRGETLERGLMSVGWGSVHRSKQPLPSFIPVAPPPPVFIHQEPLPEPEPPVDMHKVEVEKIFDVNSMDKLHTVLYAQISEPFYTYNRVPWSLEVRKEVFSPMEKLENPNVIHLIFAQIVNDVFSNESIRLGKEERSRLSKLLDSSSIQSRNVGSQNHRLDVKLNIINAAKEAPFYFSRMYPVNGGSRHPNLHLLGVSHSGVRLITRVKDSQDDYLNTIQHIQFSEILDISEAKSCTVLIRLSRKAVVVYSYMAPIIVSFIKLYKEEAEKVKYQQR